MIAIDVSEACCADWISAWLTGTPAVFEPGGGFGTTLMIEFPIPVSTIVVPYQLPLSPAVLPEICISIAG
jgi:hypothetical protein